MKSQKSFVLGMLVLPLAFTALGLAVASSVDTPHIFVSGTPALASEVNENFAAHQEAINNNDSVLGFFGTRLGTQAVAYVDGLGIVPTVVRFESRSGSTTSPTVTRLSTGVFLVNFSFIVSDRFIFVSVVGLQNPAPSDVPVFASVRVSGTSQVRVELNGETGPKNRGFFLSIQ